MRRFKNERIFIGMDSCLTIITNFEQNFQFLFPYFENFTSFIFYYKILEWWYNAWCLPHKSIYFMQNLICKINEWMNLFQKCTCVWYGCNLEHLFSYILYIYPQILITDACTNEEKERRENSKNLFYSIFRFSIKPFFPFF